MPTLKLIVCPLRRTHLRKINSAGFPALACSALRPPVPALLLCEQPDVESRLEDTMAKFHIVIGSTADIRNGFAHRQPYTRLELPSTLFGRCHQSDYHYLPPVHLHRNPMIQSTKARNSPLAPHLSFSLQPTARHRNAPMSGCGRARRAT